MSVLQAIALGIIQGITEFLPVSSSGHLLIPALAWGWPDQGIVFDVAVHMATLLAVVVYFRRRIMSFAKALVSSESTHDKRLAWYIILSIIPVGMVGMFDAITEWFRATPVIIGWSFIIWGVVLGFADWYGKHSHREQQETTKKDIIWMSLAQVLALIPGTSRSGITMTAGLFSGLNKQAAAEVSFFMAIPVIAAAGVKQLLDVSSLATVEWGMIGVGFIAAFLSAIGGIWFLLKLVGRMGYLPFVCYRVILGALILILFV